jgi:predicted metalloprotease with PDZ domain
MAAVVAMPAYAGQKGAKCKETAQACLNHLSAKKDKGWTGVDVDKTEAGTQKVKKVVSGGPAEAAGILVGDELIARNGIKLSDHEALKADKDSWKVGAQVVYTLIREGQEQKVAVTLAPIPEEVFAAMVGAHMISDHMAVNAMASTEGVNAEAANAEKANTEKASAKTAAEKKK